MKKLTFTFIFMLFWVSSFAQEIHEGFLSENSFFSWKDAIENPDVVYDLVLTDKELTILPTEIAKFQNLRNLNLSLNQLKTLPKEIGTLSELTKLWCRENQLTTLPKEIAELKNLLVLDLTANQLTALPKEIKNLQNLTILDLNGNNFSDSEKEKIKAWLPKCEIQF